MNRTKEIMKVSGIGIATNIGLSALKFAVGTVAHSQAVMSDAANNLGDAMGSIVTIIGTKLSAKSPEKKHPFGYGRIEYMTEMIVAFLVAYVGVEAFFDSIHDIRFPVDNSFSTLTLSLLVIGLAVKLILGLWTKKKGTSLKASALVASGTDAFSDSILSAATLISALISRFFSINIGGWVSLVISIFIIKSGLELIQEPLENLVGERPDSALSAELKKTIQEFPEVEGVYDLILNAYGNTFTVGSVHIQIPDSIEARDIQKLTRAISKKVYNKYKVILTIGIYAANTSDPISFRIRKTIDEILKDYTQVLQIHGFYVDLQTKVAAFDLIFDYDCDAQALKNEIRDRLIQRIPDYTFDIVVDQDFTD